MKTWTSDELNRIGAAQEQRVVGLRRLGMISSDRESAMLGRRAFLRVVVAGVAGLAAGALLSACSDSAPTSPVSTVSPASPKSAASPTAFASPTAAAPAGGADNRPEDIAQTPAQPTPAATDTTGSGSKVLLVYFSRAGENYYYGGRTSIEVGNTEVVAGMISRLIGCDVYRIEAGDPYPEDYEETVARNVREQNTDARPAIANPLASIDSYDTVLLGSPIWNVRAPQIMSTFVEGFDFAGKTIFPFTTYAMSGLGTTVRDYTAACPGATIGAGLAVQGEEARDASVAVEEWLRRIGLLKG